MGGRFEKTPSSLSSKRRRRNYDCAESSRKRRRRNYDCAESSRKRRRRNYDCAESSSTRRKQHLYLALDDWEGGYHIYKLDADEIYSGGLHELPEPAIRINSSVHGPMDFAALGTSIFVALNLRYYFDDDDAPPTIVYNTKTAALGVGPPLPSGIPAFWAAMAAGEKLYALTTEVLSLQALSWAPANNTWNLRDDEMDWLWNSEPSLPPCSGLDVVAYALHPDGRTIFMSTASATHSFDTSNGLWKELGDWVLPFRGQAYFDASLDAWVGIHHKGEGYVCCCPVASRSTAAKRPPDCRMLKEKLFRHNNEEPWISGGRHMDATLTYTGYNRFCLVENILRHENAIDSMLHVTLFSLKYDSVGELRTKVQPCTRSYAVSKNTMLFSHAAFWM